MFRVWRSCRDSQAASRWVRAATRRASWAVVPGVPCLAAVRSATASAESRYVASSEHSPLSVGVTNKAICRSRGIWGPGE